MINSDKLDKWIEFPKGVVNSNDLGIVEGSDKLYSKDHKHEGYYKTGRSLSSLEKALAAEIFKLREMLRDKLYGSKGKGIDAIIPDPLKPEPGLLIKLGSLAVHYEELLAPGGHEFDKEAIDTILQDPEVIDWRQKMDALAFLPVKRGG